MAFREKHLFYQHVERVRDAVFSDSLMAPHTVHFKHACNVCYSQSYCGELQGQILLSVDVRNYQSECLELFED